MFDVYCENEKGEKAWWRCSKAAEIARFTKKEYDAYEDSLKAYRDWVNTIKTAEKKAFQEGREKERIHDKMPSPFTKMEHILNQRYKVQ